MLARSFIRKIAKKSWKREEKELKKKIRQEIKEKIKEHKARQNAIMYKPNPDDPHQTADGLMHQLSDRDLTHMEDEHEISLLKDHTRRSGGSTKDLEKSMMQKSMKESEDAGSQKTIGADEKRVEVKAIEFDWILKEKEGSQLLKWLSNTKNMTIFKQPIIEEIIMFQWQYYKYYIIFALSLPFLMYSTVFLVYVTYVMKRQQETTGSEKDSYDISAYVMLAFTILFMIYFTLIELRQICYARLRYFINFWNLMDLTSLILNAIIVGFNIADYSVKDSTAIASVAVILMWFKAFYFLRAFEQTSYLIRMIIEIVWDVRWFFLIFVVGVLGFANVFYVLVNNQPEGDPPFTFMGGTQEENTFFRTLNYTYQMAWGGWDTDGFENHPDKLLLQFIFFMLTIMIFLLLLNLVIAIMGDTFGRVQETQHEQMLKEICNLIKENEILINRKRKFKNVKYIVVVQPETVEGAGESNWEGSIGKIKSLFEESSVDHIAHLEIVEKSIEKHVAEGIEDRMRQVEDRVVNKITTADTILKNIMEEFRINRT